MSRTQKEGGNGERLGGVVQGAGVIIDIYVLNVYDFRMIQLSEECRLRLEMAAAKEGNNTALLARLQSELMVLETINQVGADEVVALSPMLPDGTREWAGIIKRENL